MELTSRVSTDEVAIAKQKLEKVFGSDKDTLDVALATNMISVGLDISRLGLLIVQGQPKTAAEYIQATSRVGRDKDRPGIVFAVLNLHRSRDRMHFQQFGHFHQSFYRSVEATSVTPWAIRALDRALAAVLVSLIRHSDSSMSPEYAVTKISENAQVLDLVSNWITQRANDKVNKSEFDVLKNYIEELFNSWKLTVNEQTKTGSLFLYADGKSPHRLLHAPLEHGVSNLSDSHKKFTASRSMRDVEATVPLNVLAPDGKPISIESRKK